MTTAVRKTSPQTLSGLYHFWVAYTRVHYCPNSIYEYFLLGNANILLPSFQNLHINSQTPVMHGIVSFQ